MPIAWKPKRGGILSIREWEERNGIDFNGEMLLMYTILEYWNIFTHEDLI